jgi:5,10-methylenetetrahydromethanopterin reductase
VLVAASGPKALRLAGEVGDGAIIQVGCDPEVVREAVASVRMAAAGAGRDPAAVRIVASVFAVVSDNRQEDIDRARPLAGYFYSVTPWLLERCGFDTRRRFPDRVPEPDLTPARDWAAAWAAARTFIPDGVVERFCLVGPPEAAVERIRALARAGVDEVFLRWWSSYQLPLPLMEVFGRRVMPAFG